MPRYLVERTFTDGLRLSGDEESVAAICDTVVLNNTEDLVTWIHSYVSKDPPHKMFCIYVAPSPEAIRRTAQRNSLPIDRITRVSVLDPYFLH